jgi:hypothetical protein
LELDVGSSNFPNKIHIIWWSQTSKNT